MAESYSFFQCIPSNIPETDRLEIIYVDEDTDCLDTDSTTVYEIQDNNMDEKYCKCGDVFCSVNAMSSVQQLQMQRFRDFDNFFPDLFLDEVPLHYKVPDIYNIFNKVGNGIVASIIFVPGEFYNKAVVKFHTYTIPQHTYEQTICMRWELFKDSLSGECGSEKTRWFELDNVYLFNSAKWDAQKRFGLEYIYSLNDYSALRDDPRSIHLYKYLKDMHFAYNLTEDAIDLISEDILRMDQYEFDFNQSLIYKSDDDTNVAVVAELEDGEVDESVYNSCFYNNDNISVDDLYYNNYIYKSNEESSPTVVVDTEVSPTILSVISDIDTLHSRNNPSIHDETRSIIDADLYSTGEDDDNYSDYPHEDSDDEDEHMYEYCEISEGVLHRRMRDPYEDPDELHFRINNATNPIDRARAFWNN